MNFFITQRTGAGTRRQTCGRDDTPRVHRVRRDAGALERRASSS